MKKLILFLSIIIVAISVEAKEPKKPVYNKSKTSIQTYHTKLKKYYVKKQKVAARKAKRIYSKK